MKVIAYLVLLFLIFYSIYILFKPNKNKKGCKSKSIPVSQAEESIKVYPDGRIVFPKRKKEPTKEPPLKDGYKRFYLKEGFIDYKPPRVSRGNPIDDILYSTFIEEKEKQKKQTGKRRIKRISYKYRQLRCRVAGTFYRSNSAKKVAKSLKVGDSVYLAMEPSNMYDCCAVKVMRRYEHIGYIPASLSPEVTNGILLGGYSVYVSYINVYRHDYFGDAAIDIDICLTPKEKER
jgi:hypothetical protein